MLIQVRAAGVCLSDAHLIDGSLALPSQLEEVTLGHEVAGVIHSLGADVEGWNIGDRVALQAGQVEADGRVLTRGVDYDGGWAEYALARVDTLVALPDELSFDQAAIIPDAVSTPWAAVTATADVRPGESVAVWGLGGLGTHALQLLRLVGAAPIIAIDPLPGARERALAFGADAVLDPSEDVPARIQDILGNRGLDAAFDFAGVDAARRQALASLGVSGRLTVIGLNGQPISIDDSTAFGFKGQRVLGHYGSRANDVSELVELTRWGRLDLERSITKVLPLADAQEAVRQLVEKDGDPIRLILRP